MAERGAKEDLVGVIIVRIIGGLGNQMFQYAMGRSLSLDHHAELKLDLTDFKPHFLHAYALNHFHIAGVPADDQAVNALRPSLLVRRLGKVSKGLLGARPSGYILERTLEHSPELLVGRKKPLYIEGYWQSEKYFGNIRAVLVREFRLKNSLNENAVRLWREIVETNSVGVHVRRGDYAADAKTRSIHGLCPFRYYGEATGVMRTKVSNPVFYVFSDDTEAVKREMPFGERAVYVADRGSNENFEDLFLMSQCKHNIIANSSFSWWGAWLNQNPEKIVIAPARWFNVDSEYYSSRTIVPENWMRL